MKVYGMDEKVRNAEESEAQVRQHTGVNIHR